VPEAQFQSGAEQLAERERWLIEHTIGGDEDAFRQLVEIHYRAVLAAAYRALGNMAQAEDTAQDIFVKVFQNLRGYRFEQPFIHWLHRVTSNAIVDALRRRRPLLSLDARPQLPAGDDDPQRVLLERDLAQRLAAAVARLPRPYRTTLILRAYHELSYEEIAATLGIPLGTVMSRLHNAKEILRKSLRDQLETEDGRQPGGQAEVNKS
jgi:RNA polymerase sigma-70 factor, ECF subfamily